MRLLSLRARNFRQHVDTALNFSDGITAIIGPNGSGKSTVLEAIAWAIYGTPAIRGVADSIRWKHAKPRARVEVELRFDLDGHEYRVVRSLHHAEVYLDQTETPVASGKDGVTEYLRRQLGMSREEFFNTYFTGQQELDFLTGLKGVGRSHFLSRILGYEKLKNIQDALRQSRNTLRTEIEALRHAAIDPETAHRNVQAAEEALHAIAGAMDEAQQDHNHRAKVVERLAPQIAEAETARRRDELLRMRAHTARQAAEEAVRAEEKARHELARIEACEKEIEVLRAKTRAISSLEAEVQAFEEAARASERKKSLRTQIQDLDQEIARTGERLERLRQAPEYLARFQQEVETLEREYIEIEHALEQERESWEATRRDIAAKLEVARAKARELGEHIAHIKEAGAHGACAMCTRPLGEDYAVVLQKLEIQREEVLASIAALETQTAELQNRPAALLAKEDEAVTLREKIQALRVKMARCEEAIAEAARLQAEQEARKSRRSRLAVDIEAIGDEYDETKHQAAKDQLEILRQHVHRARWLEEIVARRPEWEREAEEAIRRRRKAENEYAQAEAERTALAFDETAFETLRAEYDQAIEALRRAELHLTELAGEKRVADERLKAANDDLERALGHQRDIAEREDRLRHHNELDLAFTELRKELNERIRPELAEIASELLAELTDGRYDGLELDENYELVVLEHGAPRPVISGGEEAVANLALRLALSQMVADRAGRSFSLLILDEVFGSLDNVRRDNVLRILRSLEQRFAQILLITHVDDIREAADRVIRLSIDPKTEATIVQAYFAPDPMDTIERAETIAVAKTERQESITPNTFMHAQKTNWESAHVEQEEEIDELLHVL